MAKKEATKKKIELTYMGKQYTLEFNRRTVVKLEKALKAEGVSLVKMTEKENADPIELISIVDTVFTYAFKMHHPNVTQDVIDTIFEKMGNKEQLSGVLFEIMTAPINALADNKEGEITWAAE
jgi:hypothetical protein